MVLDDSACAIVCGYVNTQFSILKYGPDGVFRWIKQLGSGEGRSVCVDKDRNIYATGVVSGTGDDIFIAKLNPAGDTLWTYKYNGPANGNDRPGGIAVDKDQNCYVGGESPGGATNTDFVTIKINANGTFGWAQRYNGASNGHDYGKGIAVDASANVYVVGESYVYGAGQDACILSYTSGGSQRYVKTFNAGTVYDDSFYAVTIDADQNVLAAGYVATGSYYGPFFTVKMRPNATGDTVWTRRHTIPGTYSGAPSAIVTDPLGKVYVSGQCWASTADVGVICFSVSGNVLWSVRYDGPAQLDEEYGYSIATSGNGMVYVAGSSANLGSYVDYALFAFQETGTDVRTEETLPSDVVLAQNYPNPFNPSTLIEYRVPVAGGASGSGNVRLAVFDLLGREVALLVDEKKSPGVYAATFNAAGLPSGVYFYRLQAGDITRTKRMTLIR
jgi:hypothetical protein